METPNQLSREAVAKALPDRAFRVYPAVLSTEADALAWARAEAPHGAVVVADYQASPRGRAGLEWKIEPGKTLCFSMVLRAHVTAEREGWFYTVAASGAADALDLDATIRWPDEIRTDNRRVGAVASQAGLGVAGVEWAVISVLVEEPSVKRSSLLGRIAAAIEARSSSIPADVLDDYLPRCETIGKRVTARMIPLGPGGVEISGTAVGSLTDGALLVETEEGRRIAVRPQNLGILEQE